MDKINIAEELITTDISYSDEGCTWYGDLSDKPDIEQDLHKLQNDYYSTDNACEKNKIFSQMFTLIQAYARSIFLKKVKGHNYVDPDVVQDKATYAALTFMSQYINRTGFHVGTSFGGMLEYKVREAKSLSSEEDNHISLNTLIASKDNDNLDFSSLQEKAKFDNIFTPKIKSVEDECIGYNIKDVIQELLEDFDKGANNDNKLKLYVRFWLAILLRKPRNKHGKSLFCKYTVNDIKYKKALYLFELELYNRLSGL